MALINEEGAAELVGTVRAARNKAHDMVGEQLAQGRERLRSSSKTRKSVKTRQRIMEAASELMVERGNTGFQMSEVSDRCQMSKGSLYYYYADKDELIAAIFDESVDNLVDATEQLAAEAGSAREALSLLYASFVRRLRAGSPLSLAMTYELAGTKDGSLPQVTSRFERVAKVLASQLERAKAEGLVREDVDTSVAAVFATGGLIASSMAVVAGGGTDSVDAITTGLLDMIVRGVGVEGEPFTVE
jgi:AcrR family transcriptional regulator